MYILACESPHAHQIHQKAMIDLKSDICIYNAAPIIQCKIKQCLEQRRKGYKNPAFNDLVVSDETQMLVRQVFQKQINNA